MPRDPRRWRGSGLTRSISRPARRTTATGCCDGVRSERTVWINGVPEPKTVKNRVHLDLVRRSTGPLVALGGHELREVMGGGETWIVVDDPDGAELCVFDSAQGEPSALVVDSVDAVAQAQLVGRRAARRDRARHRTAAPRWLAGVSGLPFEVWKFVPVPEPKTVKNRMHWDVVCPDVDALVARGATVLRVARRRDRLARARPTPRATSSARSRRRGRRMTALDLTLDGAALTVALCDIESVSGDERQLADLIEAALARRRSPHGGTRRERAGRAYLARSCRARRDRRATSTRCRSPATCRAGSPMGASTAAARPT